MSRHRPADWLTVAIAEAHEAMRRALSGLVDGEPDMRVVGVAHDPPGLLRLLARQQPHVLLLDANVLHPGGLRTLPLIGSASPGTAILLTAFPQGPGYHRMAHGLGIAGLIDKSAEPTTWLAAIRTAAKTHRHHPPPNK